MADLAPEGTRSDAKQHEKAYDSFDSMGLREDLLRGVRAYGLEKPSAIQQRGIVAFCERCDVIIEKDQSGTTKTATFCVGILQRLDYNVPECQAVVIAPTRELALQIKKLIRALGEYLGVRVHASVGGGAGVVAERQILSCGVHVLVGTPGLVFGVLRRSSVRGECVKMFVLDGIDEMLSRGFKDHIHEMFQLLLPPKIQVGVVSATMLPEVIEITTKFMNTPVKIPDLSKDR